MDNYIDWDQKDLILIQAPTDRYNFFTLGSITQIQKTTYEFVITYHEDPLIHNESRKAFPEKINNIIESGKMETSEVLMEYYNWSLDPIGRVFVIVNKGKLPDGSTWIIKDPKGKVMYDSRTAL
ncbi:hypothetical protein [Laceyella putida]|uniref:Uncharacterized protein n=1 Tax=Laceyella putida TaxID=110101 RepID=A0ABW2RK54_9BACL